MCYSKAKNSNFREKHAKHKKCIFTKIQLKKYEPLDTGFRHKNLFLFLY